MTPKEKYKAAYSAYRLYMTSVTDGMMYNYQRPKANVALDFILKSLADEKYKQAAITSYQQSEAHDPYENGVHVHKMAAGAVYKWGGVLRIANSPFDEIPF